MTWNFRIINKDGQLAIYEVYYEQGQIKGFSEFPSFPRGESLLDLKADIERYSDALNKPILNYEDIGLHK